MIEIRWHGRGGQGAKTASQLLATAQLALGESVQAFPEYGPERSGAPMQAYNRVDSKPIRRHDGVRTPDDVVVLDDSLLAERSVMQGVTAKTRLIVNTRQATAEVARQLGHTGPLWCVDASGMAQAAGTKYANVVLVGVLASALGDIPLVTLEAAAREVMGRRLAPAAMEATLNAIRAGYAWAEGRRAA